MGELVFFGDRMMRDFNAPTGPLKIADPGRGGYQQRITRKHMTSAELAGLNFNKALQRYSDITDTARRNLQSELSAMEQFRYLNMKLLAAVAVFLIKVPKPEPRDFRTRGFIDMIKAHQEDPELYIKYQEDFLRYVTLVTNYRTRHREIGESLTGDPIAPGEGERENEDA